MKLTHILKYSCLLCKMGAITIMQHCENSLVINVKVQCAGTHPIGVGIASEHSEQSGKRHRQIPDVGFPPPSTTGHQSSSANATKSCIWVECPQAPAPHPARLALALGLTVAQLFHGQHREGPRTSHTKIKTTERPLLE